MKPLQQIKKIAVIGPESTGKSFLCEQLASHYNTAWVREYAREYLEKNGTSYAFDDLYKIAEGQIAGEDAAVSNLQSAVPLFIDTDLYVIKIWSEFVFNKCDNRILNQIAKRKYDLYLLCDIDLPWVKDNLREYPDITIRKKLFRYYMEDLSEQKTPWVIISGNYEERLQNALAASNKLW